MADLYEDTYSDTYGDATAPTTQPAPVYHVYIAFDSDPNDADVWTDVTGDVLKRTGITTFRGRNTELDDFTVGTAALTLKDTTRKYDPLNTAGTYFGKLTPNRRVKVTVEYAAVEFPLHVGYIEAFPQVTERGDVIAYVPIVSHDEMKRVGRNSGLAGTQIRPSTPWILDGGEASKLDSGNLVSGPLEFPDPVSSGVRVEQILTAVGVRSDRMLIHDGDSAVMADKDVTEDAAGYLRKIAKTEMGRLFCGPDGVIRFQSRKAWTRNALGRSSQATFTDTGSLQYSDIVIDAASEQFVKNRVRRGRKGGPEIVAQDLDSIDSHGVIEDSETDLLFHPPTQAADQARFILSRYADPETRITAVVIEPHRDPVNLFPQVLFRQIGDRITISRTPLGAGDPISVECWIESVTHQFDGAGKSWKTTWTLSEAETQSFFTLDHPTLSVLDNGVLISY